MTDPFPPPNFVRTESAVAGIEVYAPAPPDVEHRPVVEFKCPQCSAGTAYSAAEGGLVCTSCGYYEPTETPIVGRGAAEFEFKVETLARAAHGWGAERGAERKELQCQNCGAQTSVPQDSLTHTCPFCGSNQVVQRAAPGDVLRPRFLVPFQLEVGACRRIVLAWLGSSWMTPAALRQLAGLRNFTGIYLPFWTFDARTRAAWRAEVGHTKTERYRSGGEWKTRTVTEWRWESGRVDLTFDDVLVDGTQRVSTVLLERINDFDLNHLAAYEPKYLAGFQAQTYDVPLEPAWKSARYRMRERTREACRGQASTSKIRNFSMTLDFADESWRYILLPVYLTTYAFGGETYQVMINGQTGAIAGQRPVDWRKVWLVVAALLVPGLLAGVASVILSGQPATVLGLVGAGLVIAAIIAALVLVSIGQRMDDA